MAKLYFAVWRDAGAVALGDPLQEDMVSFAGTSVQTVALVGTNRQRNRVRVFSDGDCFVTWGLAPIALNDGTDGRPLGASNPEYFDIEAGYKLAVIERI